MKVRDLIDQLQQFDADDEVHISFNYGDHWRTIVAPKVRRVEMLPVVESEYHRMPMVIDEEDNRYDDADQVVDPRLRGEVIMTTELRDFILEVLSNEKHCELVERIFEMIAETPDQLKNWEDMFEDYKEMGDDTMTDDFADVLKVLADNDGACLYWQMPDAGRCEAAVANGKAKIIGDLLVHPQAKELEVGTAYTMESNEPCQN
jgi:hypothetical protein